MPTTPAALVASPHVADAPGNTRQEALRYLIASIFALALDSAVLALLVAGFGLPPWVGGAIAYLTGLVLVYVLSIHWVFGRRTVDSRAGEFAIFATLGLAGLVLNSTVLYVATAAGLALPFAKALSAAVGFTANFVSRKVILFSGGR